MKTYNRTCKHPRTLWIGITLIGLILDMLSKLIVEQTMAVRESIPILRGVLHITHIENPGAAFGMLSERRWVFLVVSSLTILFLLAFLLRTRSHDPLLLTSLAMVLSGGIGNMIDRLALGYVVDMIDFCLIDFAVFNVADSFVCVGAALLFLAVLFEARSEAQAKPTSGADGAEDRHDGADH